MRDWKEKSLASYISRILGMYGYIIIIMSIIVIHKINNSRGSVLTKFKVTLWFLSFVFLNLIFNYDQLKHGTILVEAFLFTNIFILSLFFSRTISIIMLYISTLSLLTILEMPFEHHEIQYYTLRLSAHLSIFCTSICYMLYLLDIAQESIQYDNQLAKSLATVCNESGREIRTIATTIVGYIALLSNMTLSLQQREYVNAVKDSVDYLISFVYYINLYIRVETKTTEVDHSTNFHVDVLLDTLLGNEKLIYKNNVNIVMSVDPNIPKVLKGHVEYLDIILRFILDNARKFTSEGSIQLKAKVIKKDRSKCKISFTVSDTGVGIPHDQLPKIQGILNNEDVSFGLKDGSAPGIGMPLCSKLTKLFEDGRLDINSKLNVGTDVSFTASFDIGSEEEPEDIVRNNQQTYGRVLILSDEPYLSSILSMLKWKGYKYFQGTDNQNHVLGILRQAAKQGKPFDVLFVNSEKQSKETVDILFIRVVRDQPLLSNLKIILIASKQYIKENSTEYFDGYLYKPVLLKSLCYAVNRFTSKEFSDYVDLLRKQKCNSSRSALDVLIAEDNFYNRVVLKNLITNEGHRCYEATDGLECFNLYQKHADTIDVIFMDYLMPVLDGLEATEKIREYEATNGLPRASIIGLTADDNVKSSAIDSGMDEIFIKPTNNTTVQKLLKEISIQKGKRNRDSFPEGSKKDEEDVEKRHGCMLVVEDNPFIAKITTTLLLRNNWDVDLAIDGLESVERLKSNYDKYACVLMDIYLPHLDGISATIQIRSFEVENNLGTKPIIMLTADDTEDVRTKCIESGCTYYLQKPLNYQRLIKLLTRYGNDEQIKPDSK